ncbi:MAG TPA: hypothetical protein VH502_11950, partial [Actinoplanes sp.]
VTGMNTGLSPEWDRWFDEAFTDLITRDEELIQQEFDALIRASWRETSPPPPAPPAPSTAVPSEIPSTEGRSEHREMPGTDTPTGEPPPPPG